MKVVIEQSVFRALLDWFMCSDPWPLNDGGHETIETFLDEQSTLYGYPNWVVAYHEVPHD